MVNKIFGSILFFVLSFLPMLYVQAQTNSNAGFVPANIWYSEDSFREGDKIKIYTVIFNPEKRELSGTVSFFDNELLLGKKDFVIPTVGTKDVYIDWTVTLGTHKIFATITDTKYLVSKGVYESVTPKENTSETSSYTVYKPILPKIGDIKDKVQEAKDIVKEPVNDLQQKILDSTPDYVSGPIVSTSNFLEDWRGAQSAVIETKKANVKSEIDIIKKESAEAEVLKEVTDIDASIEKDSEPKTVGKDFRSLTSTPFKYVWLFFLTLLSYIVGYKIVFYSALVIIFALFVRLVWKKIFK